MTGSEQPAAAAEALAAVPFLAPLDPVDLAKLAGVLEDSWFDAGTVVFEAGLDNGDAGIFRLVRSHVATTIATMGDAAPDTGGGIFTVFGTTTASGGRVLFAAAVTGGSVRSGLFLWRDGRITKIAGEGEAAPGGGTFAAIAADNVFPLALRGRIAAFVPRVVLDDPLAPIELGRVFVRRKGAPQALLGEGDATSLGGTISALPSSGAIALADGSVVFAASLTGAEAVAAVFARAAR